MPSAIQRLSIAATAGALGLTVAGLAAPAWAAPTASVTINGNTTLGPNGKLVATGTYTCNGLGSGAKAGVIDKLTQDSFRTNKLAYLTPVTCDGATHPYDATISSALLPFERGTANFSTTWDFYSASEKFHASAMAAATVTVS